MARFNYAQNLISILYIVFDNYVNFFLLWLLVKFTKPTSLDGSNGVPSVIFAHDMKLAAHHYKEKLLVSKDEEQAAKRDAQNKEYIQYIIREVW